MKEPKKPRITPVTYTCKEATLRHRGTTHIDFIRMCNEGDRLRRKYGGEDKVPLEVRRQKRYLFAQKPGKMWQIPVAELDRHFLGK